jgi:hypothetical protein
MTHDSTAVVANMLRVLATATKTAHYNLEQIWLTLDHPTLIAVRNRLHEIAAELEIAAKLENPAPAKPSTGGHWEFFQHDLADGSPIHMRRCAVPGGWLYQVAYAGNIHGQWHPPTFVPEPEGVPERLADRHKGPPLSATYESLDPTKRSY